MKRVLLFTLSFLFVFASVALAQHRRAPGAMRGPGAPGLPRAGAEPLAEYLDLTDAQKAAWEAIREETHQTIEPLHEQGQALAAQLETTDDAPGIGDRQREYHTIGKQARTPRRAPPGHPAEGMPLQRRILLELGCPFGQGYYYGHPRPE